MSEELPAFGTDRRRDPDFWPSGAGPEAPVDLPLDFEVYVLDNCEAFLRFAIEMLATELLGTEPPGTEPPGTEPLTADGSPAAEPPGLQTAAARVVQDAFVHIAAHWHDILREPDAPGAAWDILARAVVAEIRHIRGERWFAERIAEVNGILARMRAEIPDLDSAFGLYPALAELPPREFDVIMLKGPMRLSTPFTAWILDLHSSTVDRTYNRAVARLAADLAPRCVLHPADQHPDLRPRRKGARR